MRIVASGCLPPTWPRPPWPPVPEPEPDSLDTPVNWLTYSHPELYSMIHNGLDLTGAMAVSAQWARLGEELGEIGDELAKLLFATAAAWEGDAAELAQESVSALADWATRTGTMATEVSGCVTIQVDNATTARNSMPAPPYPIDPGAPMPDQVTAFTTGDFETAKPMVEDSMVYTSQERALHQQAASTMERFQESSRDVYATVPQFAPPNLRRMPFGPPEEIPTPSPTPPPTPTPTPLPGRFPTGGTPGPTGGGPGGGPGGGSSGGAGPAPGRVQGAPPAPGSSTGAGPTDPATRPAAATTQRHGTPATAPGGGMPMGGGAGQRNEDTERRSKRYVDEDADVWGGNDQQVVPPVIGEVNRRA